MSFAVVWSQVGKGRVGQMFRGMALRSATSPLTSTSIARRHLAVYAVGEGWTGALGTGRLDLRIAGHLDDEEPESAVLIYEGPVQSVSLGFGHSALVTADNKLLVTGRPHDFSALMRLRRLPKWIRDYSVKQTYESTLYGDDDHGLTPTSLVGRLVTWLSDVLSPDSVEWELARSYSFLAALTEIKLPDKEVPVKVLCSAGFTACVSQSGTIYAFGLNGFGQCGRGHTSNNVWEPAPVTGLSADFAEVPRAELEQTHPISAVALGLQHGMAVNDAGEVFAWGKGERGQLGQEMVLTESHTALPIKRAFSLDADFKPHYESLGTVKQIAAGMIHSAALNDDNKLFIWGKNTLPQLPGDEGKIASDARLPAVVRGLPAGLKVLQIACGSHHTAMLLEDGSVWAVGISSDTTEPVLDPVVLIPAGILELPVRQFSASMDRTTIVGRDGRQVLQVHLWKDPNLQEYAAFTPAWVDRFLEDHPETTIREVHRSWIHSILVTD